MMAALIDLEASDTQLLPRPHLSQDTLASMALLCDEALEATGIASNPRPTDGGTVLENQYSRTSPSDPSTHLSQLLTHTGIVDFKPALSTRSSDTVIADLKIGRYQRQRIHATLPVANTPANNQHED